MADKEIMLNKEITDTLKEIADEHNLPRSTHNTLLSILNEIAATNASAGQLQDKINFLISGMRNEEKSE